MSARLSSFADLGAFHNRSHRQSAASLDELRPNHPQRIDSSVDHRQAERPAASLAVGFIVAITTRRSSGFLTAPEEKDPSLGERKDAWIFPSRAAVKVALARALGLNLSRCRVDVLPSFVLGTGEAA